jgi:hypothetical protein
MFYSLRRTLGTLGVSDLSPSNCTICSERIQTVQREGLSSTPPKSAVH